MKEIREAGLGRQTAVSLFITVCLWIMCVLMQVYTGIFRCEYKVDTYPYRAIHFLFLYILIRRIVFLFAQRKEENIRRSFIYSGVFLLLAGGLFFLVYPGSYSWDDVFIYTSALHLELSPWQHFFSGLFHILCLLTVPIAGAAPLMQVIIASLIAGYVPVTVGSTVGTKNRLLLEAFIFLPMLFPPLLIYLYSGFRMGIIPYLEWLLVIMLFSGIKQENLPVFEIIHLALLTVLVSSWRTENAYYTGLFILFLLLKKKCIPIRRTAVLSFCVLAGIFLIGKVNANMIGNENYQLMATIVPMKEMVTQRILSKEDEETVDRVLKTDFIREYDMFSAEELYFMQNGMVREAYTDEQYREYRKVYVKNVIRHPLVFFHADFEIFKKAAGCCIVDGKSMQRTPLLNTAGGADTLFDGQEAHSTSFLAMSTPLTRPVSESIRLCVLKGLQCVDDNKCPLLGYFVFWNLYAPLLCLLPACIAAARKKEWFMLILALSVLLRFAVVFMTAVAPYIMYYLSAYLLGYEILILSYAVSKDGLKEQERAGKHVS